MNVLLLNSSYRTDGNTALALASLKDGLVERGIEVDEIDLAHRDIRPCRGCRLCFDRGEGSCPLRDDLPRIRDAIESHDATVFASPIYVEDVNGVMKNFIDRMAYNCHRPRFFSRCAFVLTTSGAGSSNHGLKTMERAAMTWGFALAGRAKFKTGARMSKGAFEEAHKDRIARAVLEIEGAANHSQKPSFTALMAFAIQKDFYLRQEDKSSMDYRYWSDRGWLDAGRAFYAGGGFGAPKAWAAKFFGKLVSSLILK
jgi:multimeric flavodoxin WrbA